jgi:LPXTG-motif cell wall-anchored protein
MIRRIVLVVGALLVASVWFGSAAHAGSYTPPSSAAPAVSPQDQVSGQSGATSGQLPQTGSNTTESLLRIGIILVVCGGVLAFAASRRRASTTS